MTFVKVTRFGKTFTMDHSLIMICEKMMARTKLKWDNLFIVDGKTGTGKTKGIAFPMSYFLAGKFKLVFTYEQFKEAYDNCIPGDVILWDEFVNAGLGSQAASKMQIDLIKKLVMGRFKGAYIFILIPNFWLLRWYFGYDRSYGLINVYSPDYLNRGFANFYGEDHLTDLYEAGKNSRTYNHNRFKYLIDKRIRFPHYPDGFFMNEEEYNKQKEEAFRTVDDVPEEKEKQTEIKWKKIVYQKIDWNETNTEIADELGVSEATIRRDRKKYGFASSSS